MEIDNYGFINIFGVKADKLNDEKFLNIISKSISEGKKLTIAYANADSLNKIYSDEELKNIYKTFDIIHPDGIGVYAASKFLYGKNGFEERLTGSDFYEKLIKESVKKGWNYFFFGHTKKVLDEIQTEHPLLKISGTNEGYNFDNDEVIQKINELKPDVIIIGLSCPKQEKWIFENKDKLKSGILFAVGDGIKVFAGKKIRGPVFMRKFGLEWLVRFALNPLKNFKKYIIGNPLFIYRVLKESFKQVK